MEPAIGMFIDLPSPPVTPFIAQNIERHVEQAHVLVDDQRVQARAHRRVELERVEDRARRRRLVGQGREELLLVLRAVQVAARAGRTGCGRRPGPAGR